MKKIIRILSLIIFLVIAFGVLNAYFFAPGLRHQGEVVAYRGGGNSLDYKTLNETGCTAKSLLNSEINTVENTLEAVSLSVDNGADNIHLNVHRTQDDQLVVFHDWTLDCATDAHGPINKMDYADLAKVDAGFGYTFDKGTTFPFRGRGFRIARLDEFFSRFPQHQFWLNLKDNDNRSFQVLNKFLVSTSSVHAPSPIIITSPKGVNWFKQADPSVSVVSVEGVKDCAVQYLLLGWAGLVPDVCKNTTMLIPPSKAKYFWGYPQGLAARLQEHGTTVYLWFENQPLDQKSLDVIAQGVGVVTNDTALIGKLHPKNSRQ